MVEPTGGVGGALNDKKQSVSFLYGGLVAANTTALSGFGWLRRKNRIVCTDLLRFIAAVHGLIVAQQVAGITHFQVLGQKCKIHLSPADETTK